MPSLIKQWTSGREFEWLLAGITALNLFQAAFTELDPDEAYYWMYSRALDFGYFDHPPMIAAMIRLGYGVFSNPMGVRLLTVLFMTGTIFLFWLLAGKPRQPERINIWLALALGFPMLHIFGFIATPDSPLFFFSTLFLYLYQQFLRNPSWAIAFTWGGIMAALLYSKYHGILLIFFTLLSNLKLLRSPKFYIAGIFGAILFLPHLCWQYSNDFPSFRYHLSGRDDPYEFKHTYTYLLNQLAIYSPLLFPLLVKPFSHFQKMGVFEKSLAFICGGFWIFFLWATTKGHVEPQWTGILTIPLGLLAFNFSYGRKPYSQWLIRLGLTTFAAVMIARVLLVWNFAGIRSEFHNRAWVAELKEKAGALPVIFQNSYRDASKYSFYSGQSAYTFTNVFYRHNQFDIWNGDEAFQNQKAFFVLHNEQIPCNGCVPLELTKKSRKSVIAEQLQVVQKVWIEAKKMPIALEAGKEVTFMVDIRNPYPFDIIPDKGNLSVRFYLVLLRQGQVEKLAEASLFPMPEVLAAGRVVEGIKLTAIIPPDLLGSHELVFGIGNGDLFPAWSSSVYPARIIAGNVK